MDETSGTPATLLVYDFAFASHKSSARIKNAEIELNFQPKTSDSIGPLISTIKPKGTHHMIDTEEKRTSSLSMEGSLGANIAGANLGGKISPSRKTEKTVAYATAVIGRAPANEYGDRFKAQWSLLENSSQQSGIPAFLRIVVLLRRKDQAEFICIPSIEVKLDIRSNIYTLFNSETTDDNITFDPEFEPFIDRDEIKVEIDRDNLGSADLDALWDITFNNCFRQPIKPSKLVVAGSATED